MSAQMCGTYAAKLGILVSRRWGIGQSDKTFDEKVGPRDEVDGYPGKKERDGCDIDGL
jgi:hypothetical protein